MTKLEVRPTVRFTGLKGVAGELGVSVYHLRAVLLGRRRPGPALAEKLASMGLKPRKLRKPEEQWV